MVKCFTILPLDIHKEAGSVSGSTSINDSVITCIGTTVEELIDHLKELVYEFEGIRIDGFEISEKELSLH